MAALGQGIRALPLSGDTQHLTHRVSQFSYHCDYDWIFDTRFQQKLVNEPSLSIPQRAQDQTWLRYRQVVAVLLKRRASTSRYCLHVTIASHASGSLSDISLIVR